MLSETLEPVLSENVTVPEHANSNRFWLFETDSKQQVKSVAFVDALIEQLLMKLGFRNYRAQEDNEYQLVQVTNGIAYWRNHADIRYILRGIVENARVHLSHEKYIMLMTQFIKKQKSIPFVTDTLPIVQVGQPPDTRKSCSLIFKNGVLKISPDQDMELTSFNELPNPIFAESLTSQNPIYNRRDFNECPDEEPSQFETFLRLVTQSSDNEELSEQRYHGACSIIGFMLHRFNRASKAVLLTDEEMSDDKYASNGGTGKDIIELAVSALRKVTVVELSTKNPDDRFRFQSLSPATDVIYIAELPIKFPTELIFSTVSGDIICQKKGKDSFTLTGDAKPKTLITSNSISHGTDRSNLRRFHTVSLSPFFNRYAVEHNVDYAVKHYFGNMFFSEWSDQEWTRFYHFMVFCVRQHLIDDCELRPSPMLNTETKQVRLKMKDAIWDFWNEPKIMAHFLHISATRNYAPSMKEIRKKFEEFTDDLTVKDMSLVRALPLVAKLKNIKIEKKSQLITDIGADYRKLAKTSHFSLIEGRELPADISFELNLLETTHGNK